MYTGLGLGSDLCVVRSKCFGWNCDFYLFFNLQHYWVIIRIKEYSEFECKTSVLGFVRGHFISVLFIAPKSFVCRTDMRLDK